MKSVVLFSISLVLAATVTAQTNKTVTPVKNPAPVLKTENDSVSYVIGVGVANYFKGVGVDKLNTAMMSKAINDMYGGKKALIDETVAGTMLNNYINTTMVEKQQGATKPPAPKPTTPAKPTTAILKNYNDSVGYCIGVNVTSSYKSLGIPKINTSMMSKGVQDKYSGKKPIISDSMANVFMNNYIMKLMAEKSKVTIAAGEKFLAQNKLRPEVKTTASGLQYEVVTEGTGIKPTGTDNVTCHYRGTFIDGKGFDNSYDRGQPITFSLKGVIPGWTEGLQLMSVGSKYKFYIPYQLGYGAYDYNSIPGGSALLFEVELLDVKKN